MRTLTATLCHRLFPGGSETRFRAAHMLAAGLWALAALMLLIHPPGFAASAGSPEQSTPAAPREDVGAVGAESGEAVQAPAVEEPVPDTLDLSGSWRFQTDPSEVGLSEGWHEPGYDDSEWRTLEVPASWESQDVTEANPQWPSTTDKCGYNGYAWYRKHLVIPDQWRQAEVVLRIGQIWDMDWTYLNGHRIGLTTGEGAWEKGRAYTLPMDAVLPGEDNVLVVRVFDEVGEGGIGVGPVELVNVAAAGERPAAEEEPRHYARTRNEIVRMGGSVTVDPDEKVEGDVVVIGGSATIQGYVAGNVVAVAGSVRVRDGACIDGDAVAVGGDVESDEGAVIGGQVVEIGTGLAFPADLWRGPRAPTWRTGTVGAVVGLVIWAFVALAAVLLLRRRVEGMAEALPLHPGRAIVYGLGGFVLAPAALAVLGVVTAVVTIVLIVTVVGMLLVPAVAAAFLAALAASAIVLVLGVVAVWLSIGKAVAAQFGKPDLHPALCVLIGAVIIAIASQIPHIGPLVHVTIVVFGLGLAIMTGVGADPEWAHRRLGFGRRAHLPPSPAVAAGASAPPAVGGTPAPADADSGPQRPEGPSSEQDAAAQEGRAPGPTEREQTQPPGPEAR